MRLSEKQLREELVLKDRMLEWRREFPHFKYSVLVKYMHPLYYVIQKSLNEPAYSEVFRSRQFRDAYRYARKYVWARGSWPHNYEVINAQTTTA